MVVSFAVVVNGNAGRLWYIKWHVMICSLDALLSLRYLEIPRFLSPSLQWHPHTLRSFDKYFPIPFNFLISHVFLTLCVFLYLCVRRSGFSHMFVDSVKCLQISSKMFHSFQREQAWLEITKTDNNKKKPFLILFSSDYTSPIFSQKAKRYVGDNNIAGLMWINTR